MLTRLTETIATCLLHLTLFSSIGLGLFPYKYNRHNGRLEYSRLISSYSIAINILMVSTLVYTTPVQMRAVGVRFLSDKPLNAIINGVYRVLSTVTLLGTILGNWTGRQLLRDTFNEMSELHKKYFASLCGSNHSDNFLYNCTIAKILLTLIQMASNLYGNFGANPNPSFEFIVIMLLVFMTKSVLLLVGTHFYFGTLYVCHNLMKINNELQTINHDVGTSLLDPLHEYRIDDFVKLHWRLQLLVQRICGMYQWQALMLLFSWFVSNIVSSFYFLVQLGGKTVPIKEFSLAVFSQVFLVNLVDMWIHITMCERMTNAFCNTSWILQSFSRHRHLSEAVSKRVSSFF